MTSEHPLILTRRVLQVAVTEQLELAKSWQSVGALNNFGKATCEVMAAQANAEAGRLVQRLVAVQQQIEDFDLD